MSATTAKPARQIAVTMLPGDATCLDLVSLGRTRRSIEIVIAPRALNEGQQRVMRSLIPRGMDDLEAAQRWQVAHV